MDNIRSQRNREKFSREGFLYIFDKKSADGNRKMWRCERKDYSCRARKHTDAITGDVRKNFGDHNHDSNAAKIEVVRTVTALKQRAVNTNEGTAQDQPYGPEPVTSCTRTTPVRTCTTTAF